MKTTKEKEMFKNILIGFDRFKDKISNKDKSKIYSSIYSDGKDYMMLAKNSTFYRLKDMLNKQVKIICNLKDRDGKIGEKLLDIKSNQNETFELVLEKETPCKLYDRFLYNIKYNENKKLYSLEEHGEYFEKIKVNND